VVAHGGQIRPRRPAMGTSFEIRLPVEAPGRASGSPPADGAAHDRAAHDRPAHDRPAHDRPAHDRATPVGDAALAVDADLADGATRPTGTVLAANGTAGGPADIGGTADINGTGKASEAASPAAPDAAVGTDVAVRKRAGNGRSGRPAGAPRPGGIGDDSSRGRGHDG
jgi:hypothetical protein